MVFNSVVFLFCFLPLALLLYYITPGRAKNAVLLLESLVFYCWTGIEFLPLIACLVVFNYLWGLLTSAARAKLRAVLPLAAVLVNLGVLVYFKYANFLIETLNQLASLQLAELEIGDVLPLGISYYIFKIISYEVDVYTGKVQAERDPLTFAAYVLFFPQLIVGPIVKYRDMAPQLHKTSGRCTLPQIEHGVELFVFGLAKKVILADSIGALWTDLIGAGGVGLANVSTPLAWLGIIAYSLQLYFDFAGYSEMSNGLAALLGFDCAANFDLPYISGSITEFWRRWHISLSSWFRDYIYIPLGGNRKGPARQLFNMLLVWAATGIWHGASWNFIVWGLLNGVVIIISQECAPLYQRFHERFPKVGATFGWRLFQVVRTFWLMSALRSLDCYRDVPLTFSMVGTIFTRFSLTPLWDGSLLELGLGVGDWVVAGLGCLLMLGVSLRQRRGSVREQLERAPAAARYAVAFGLTFAVLVFGAYGVGYDASQFIYNQF